MLGFASRYLRNLAIIAHVDHGKTTLLDTIIKQSGYSFQSMDKLDLERERGITILSKVTSLQYKDHMLNFVDTPGHADFSGQVERIMNIVDGVLLVVCANEGPMPQTRYVLQKALQSNLKSIVLINKLDRATSKPQETESKIFDLYCSLDAPEEHIDYPLLYGSGKDGWADDRIDGPKKDCFTLLDKIIDYIPPPTNSSEGNFKMSISLTDTDPYFGKSLIGRIHQGVLNVGDNLHVINPQGQISQAGKASKIFKMLGDQQVLLSQAQAGDLISVNGLYAQANDTLANPEVLEPLPVIFIQTLPIDKPTLNLCVYPNDSPLAGSEGSAQNLNSLKDKIFSIAEDDIAMKVVNIPRGVMASGRGEMHLGILLENMRRDGFEFLLEQPQVVMIQDEEGNLLEPVEKITVEVPNEHCNYATEMFMNRGGEFKDMNEISTTHKRIIFEITTRQSMGLKKQLITQTKGNLVISSEVIRHIPKQRQGFGRTNGVIVATHKGVATDYGLNHLQEKGQSFIYSGQKIYEGMVIGENSTNGDLELNPCKEKKLTNIRAAGKDDKIRINPPKEFTIEDAFTFINEDEMVEITPKHIRIRKKILDADTRKKEAKKSKKI